MFVFALVFAGCSGGTDGTSVTTTTPSGPYVPPLDDIQSTDNPTKRSEVLAAAHEGSNTILIFGGNEGPIVNQVPSAKFLDDTWIFEPGYGWSELTFETKPRKRGRYAISVDEAGNRALFFGGRFRQEDQIGQDYTLFNDLWEFNYTDRTWSEVNTGNGPQPEPRYYPGSAFDPATGNFYIWGGLTNTSALTFIVAQDLWMWDGSSWTELQTTGTAPSPRGFIGSTYDPVRNKLVVIGGQRGDFTSCAYNDAYALDLTTLEWERLNDGSRKAPSTRMHPHVMYDPKGDRYLLWGGHTDIGDANDLWALSPVDNKWEEVRPADFLEQTAAGCNNVAPLGCLGNPSEVPDDYVQQDLTAPERRHRGMVALMYDNLWIALGIHAECSDQLDDTWRYSLSGPEDYVELISAKSGESCARQGDDCECLCL